MRVKKLLFRKNFLTLKQVQHRESKSFLRGGTIAMYGGRG